MKPFRRDQWTTWVADLDPPIKNLNERAGSADLGEVLMDYRVCDKFPNYERRISIPLTERRSDGAFKTRQGTIHRRNEILKACGVACIERFLLQRSGAVISPVADQSNGLAGNGQREADSRLAIEGAPRLVILYLPSPSLMAILSPMRGALYHGRMMV